MSSFDEYRKKLASKYGTSGTKKKDEEEESKQVKSSSTGSTTTSKTNSGAASKPKTSFDEYREKLNAKYRTDKVDEKGVDKWFNDADKAFKSIQDGKDKDPVSTVNSLLDSSNDVYNYFLNHKDEIEDYETWEKAISDYRSALTKYDRHYYQQERSIPDEYKGKGYDELKDMLNNMEKGSEEYNWLRSYAPYTVMGADDFDEYSKKGASIENPSMKDAEGWATVFGNRLGAKDVGNIVTYSRDNWEDIAMGEANNGNVVGSSLYHYMTDDEVSIYNYLLAKNGEEEAQEYLDSITETLNYRSGTAQGERVRGEENDILRTLATGIYGIGAGADQFTTGVKQLFSEEALPTSSAQFASAYIREDLADTGPEILGRSLGQMLYDVVTTTSNMAPSVLVGALTGMPVVGAATLGASAGGNAYGQALKEGYTPEQARNYGILIGASETVLQYLLGGISSMGGKVTGKTVQTAIQNIDNALLRAAADIGINIVSEGMEEYIQEILDPVYRNLLLGEDNEFKLVTEDAAYSFILGALTAGVMEGTPAITRYAVNSHYYNTIYGEDAGALINESLELNPDDRLAQKLRTRADEGKRISGGDLGLLVERNESIMKSNDMSAITEAAISRLSELGETGDVDAIGAALAKQAAGEKLSKTEQRTIDSSMYGQRVANELNTKNIKSGEYSSAWAEKIGTNKINPNEYNRIVAEAQATQESAETSEGINTTPAKNNPQVAKIEAGREPTPAVTVPEAAEAVSVPEEGAQAEAVEEGTAETATEVSDNENVITIEDASKKYGAQAGAMIHTYRQGQDVAKYDAAYEQAYNMGNSGVSLSYAMNSESTAYLTEAQRELAYKAGKAASDTTATEKEAANKMGANGKTGWKKGAVRGEGVTISDLKKSFNDTQNTAYKLLSTYAEATGIDIVLYRSEANADGQYEGAQGKYSHNDPGTIYIDINAGLSSVKSVNDLAKYTMLRTFAHEFTHFIENWNPVQYNEFRKLVFDTLTERGENVQDLIEEKQAQTPGMSYDKASREVVAEAMTDILPDANFVEELANNHKPIFDKLIEKLKEFVNTLRQYFNSIGHNRSREANALKEQVGDALHYVESVVKLFDTVAVQAVQNYQATVATEEVKAETETKPVETVAQAPAPVVKEEAAPAKAPAPEAGTASEKLAAKLLDGYINSENINRGGKALTSKELYALADEAFGGTQAEGAYNRKDAYDAMELAVNKFLLEEAARAHKTFNTTAKSAVSTVEFMQDMLDLLPTQNVRTQEMEDFQQFSTPPNIAYLAAWAANITSKDFVLEPSAGIGGLAVFAKAWGAEVAVNELSKRRLEVLRAMGFDHLFNENAEHIDNILPDNISPSVVIMNPPFSSTAGRTANNKTSNAEKHIDQALARLRDGGRLVAVLGKGMNDTDYYRYWDKLRKSYNIRANLSIDGNNYKKYGTTWGVQIVVIDKTGPQTGKTVTGKFTDLTEVPNVLEVIRNDRSTEIKSAPVVAGSESAPVTRGTAKGQDTVSDTVSMDDSRPAGDKGSRKRADTGRTVDASQPGIGEQSAGVQDVDRAGGRDVSGPGVLTERADEAPEKGSAPAAAEQTGAIVSDDDTMAGNDSGELTTERDEPGAEPARSGEIEQSDDGVYATFIAPDVPVKGGKKHPAVLVESAAMAAVSMPKATYKVKLPANVIKNNLSDAQLVTVTYAGQAHEQKLPDGRRKGFFVGDGTGVGKGRQIAGIILDNFMQGRTKAVWISKNNDLYGDAIRDWTATTGRSKDEVVSHNKVKPKDKISIKEGILYSTYDTLKSEKGGSRLEQIVEWLGEDFDGVIAFDEAHNMGNLFGKKGKFGKSKGSEKARAGVELQRRLPNARIVYVSATAATEVDNLAYAERIGLWGAGTAFASAQDFIAKIGASGLAAMELVIRDMKAMGTYVARSISYNGVNYDTVEHALDPMQTEIYNTMSRAWQKTMSNVQSALETTGGKYNSTERQRALGNFYSGMQRFYNQVLTSMAMPSVIADMRRELDAGHSAVLQIVNTNEAQQNKQLAEAKANGESLDNLDLTPREALLGYLMNSFPTQMFEEYTDDDGNLRSRPVMDSAGNPVQNKEAVRQRDALVAEVNQMSIPDGPLEMLFDAFGPEGVAENTGRSRRVVPKKMADGSITRVEERRTLNHRTADVQAFQDGKKRILVFSDAGGTGKSYHADRTEKNQQLRVHYVLQPGWVASNAVQGFGRTHRSNEASAPIYKLVTTNIKGQKRFTSTIARRLDQLGALTKGQRDTGSGMFGAKDNLETDLAKDSLREFYRRLGKNLIEGVDGMKTLDRLGLKEKFTDEFGGFKINDNLARDISTFLNRILALEVDEQNVVFDAFIGIYEMELEAAIQSGTLDTGMENVKADKIEVVDDKVIRRDDNTGSETHYIQAKTYTKPKVVTTIAEMSKRREGFVGVYRTENGAVRAVFRIADKTTEWGAIQKQYRLVGPNLGAKTNVWNESTLKAKAEEIDKAEWQKEWDAEVARVPEYNEDTLHMLTGALLPIWNSLPQEGNTKVKRLITHDGDAYLGRVIDKDLIDGVLNRFSINRTREVFTAQQVMDKAIDNGVRFYLTNNRTQIFRSRVSGEWRLEIAQPQNTWFLTRTYPDLIQERIQYRDRYFIPVGEKGVPVLEKILKDNPVRSTAEDTEQYQSRAYLDDDYTTYGVHWGIEAGIISRADARTVWEAIANIRKRGYNSYPTTVDGEHFIESSNVLMVVKTDYTDPVIRTIYKFNDTNESNMSFAKEWLIDAKGIQSRLQDAWEVIRVVYGEGYVTRYDFQNRWSYGRENAQGEGSYSSEDFEGEIQYQQRTSTLTNREVLEMAAGELNIGELTAAEQDALSIFQKHLARLEELQDKRAEQGRLYKEQQFGENGDREAAAETLNRMHILDEQIRTENDDLFTIEEKAVLRRILEKARKVVEQTEREHGKEILKRWRDRRNNAAAIKKYRERLRGDVDELSNWVLHPNNKDVVKHIPDALKNSVIPFLSSINFMSKQSLKGGRATVADKEFIKRLNDLKATLKPHLNVDDMYNAYTDLPPNFMDRLDTFITSAQALVENNSGEFIINQMTAEELRELSQVVRTLKEYIKNFNKFHVNAMFKHVYEAGDDTILTLGQMKSAGPRTGNVSNFVLWQQMRPAYAFERFGDGGKAIYDGLRRGQATLAFNTKKIQEFAEKAYTAAEVKAWEKEIKEIRLGGDIIKMPVSTIMSFYELSKRPQALGHILGEGIRVATFKANGKKISDVGHTITNNDMRTIIDTLTPRQKEVADTLQKFMQEQGGKWGNYVSVKRFGEELFGEKNYFPINSDGRHLSVNAEEHPAAASLYALLNMGFTKSTQEGAINRIVLYSIFDVFANHMASMAQYNAFALPVVDAIKWFNYQQKSEPDENGSRAVLSSVRDQMDRVYGVPEETRPGSGRQGYAQTFVINILKAFNGTEAQGVPTDTTGLNALRQYNMAQVAYNLRVVMQQPMAIARAAQILDYTSIFKGMKLNSKAIQRNIAEMQKYSGIAAWKSLGFYDINISRGLTEIIKHRSTVRDKISDVGMWGAEKADLMTWAAMWSAAKQEVIKKQKLTPKSEGFYEAVTELFEEVIYKTQVVDSVLTKNEFLRSKGFFSRAIGSFMSEPTTTASMLVNAFDKYMADIQRGFSKQKALKRNSRMIVRTAYVYGISAVTLAAVQAVADALRDDDDYMTFMEKWLDAFRGNAIDELIPVNKLPILSDFYEAGKELLSVLGVDTYGNAPQSVFMQWYDSLIKGSEILYDRISGADTNYTWYGGAYKLLQAASGMTGLPMATATREIITAWNNTVGGMAPSLKVKTYEPSEKAQIQYAYQDGYLTAEEATEQLIEKGVVDTEDEAYFTIAEWGDPDGSYSRYDKLYDAARNGGDFEAAMDELVSHGYTEKDVLSQLKGTIGEWYKDGEITKQQAIDMLTKHFDLESDEITATVNKWSSKVVTGIEFNDIKDEYLSGNITSSRAVEMYVRYGGYTKAEAQQKVSEWDFEEEHGFTYGNRGEQFKEGNISGAELVEMIVDFGGKSEDEARTSLVGYTKSGYEEGYFTSREAVNMMVEHGGLTEAEAEAKVQHVDFQKEYPEYELSEAQVTTYYSELEYTGLGVPEYAEYVERRKESKGVDADGDGKTDSGSVKAEVMVIIDSLPITTEQKDALYYLNGWAASRIYEAPWH